MNGEPGESPRVDNPVEREPRRQRLPVAANLPLEIRRDHLHWIRRKRVGVLREVLQLAAVVRVQLVLRQDDLPVRGGRRVGDGGVVEVARVGRNTAYGADEIRLDR